MNWKQFEIDVEGIDCDRLLSDWRWLVPQSLRPFSFSMFGDCFLEDANGSIWFLDNVSGELSEIASSRAEFLIAREKQQNCCDWYLPELVLLCKERGLTPGRGQCLSFKIPPVLSGSLEVENLEVRELMVHESISAQIHRGVKELPEGKMINRFTVDGVEP